jgi:hypothetical protein
MHSTVLYSTIMYSLSSALPQTPHSGVGKVPESAILALLVFLLREIHNCSNGLKENVLFYIMESYLTDKGRFPLSRHLL